MAKPETQKNPPTSESQKEQFNFKTLEDLSLQPETLLILKNKFPLPKNPSDKQVMAAVTFISSLLYPGKEPNYNFILSAANTELVDFSYLVTTPEGAHFQEDYKYLHHLVGTLFAHHTLGVGNLFQTRGGERFITQFPNKYHMDFLSRLLELPRVTENWEVEVFGGLLGFPYTDAAKKYLHSLMEVPKAFSPEGIAFAESLSVFGMPTQAAEFLRAVSPRAIEGWKHTGKAGALFLARKTEVRQSIKDAAQSVSNPSLLLEHMEPYFTPPLGTSSEVEAHQYVLDDDRSFRITETIWALADAAGEAFEGYKVELLAKIEVLHSHGLTVPNSVTSAIMRAAAA